MRSYRFFFLIFLALAALRGSAMPTSSDSSNSSELSCPVCLEDLVPSLTVTPPCAHALCAPCYKSIFRTQHTPCCPLCRGSFTTHPDHIRIPTPRPAVARPPAAPRPTQVARPFQPSAPPAEDEWEAIPPELLDPSYVAPPPYRRFPNSTPAPTPAAPTPAAPTPAAPTPAAPAAQMDYDGLWQVVRLAFYVFDECMRARRVR